MFVYACLSIPFHFSLLINVREWSYDTLTLQHLDHLGVPVQEYELGGASVT